MKKFVSILLALLLILSLAGCGANGSSEAMYNRAPGDSYEMSAAEVMEDSLSSTYGSSSSTALPEGRKWIITVDMDVETESLDSLLEAVSEKITALDGYVEGQRIYNGSAYSSRRYRSASITVRIPAAQVDNFTDAVAGAANVVTKNTTTDDVTTTYVDTESRLKALEVEQERLLALLEQAENMADLLEIEERLTDVRYELENYASQLRVYDNLVDYATINLNIDEVQEYTPVEEPTLWERISGGFMDSLKGLGNGLLELAVWFIVSLPYLVFYAVIAAVVILLVRKLKKKRGVKKAPATPPYYPPQNPQVKPENKDE